MYQWSFRHDNRALNEVSRRDEVATISLILFNNVRPTDEFMLFPVLFLMIGGTVKD